MAYYPTLQPYPYQDQLNQLRTANPMSGQMPMQTFPQFQAPPQMPVQQPRQDTNGLIWVQGEAGAKSWFVAPGATVLYTFELFGKTVGTHLFDDVLTLGGIKLFIGLECRNLADKIGDLFIGGGDSESVSLGKQAELVEDLGVFHIAHLCAVHEFDEDLHFQAGVAQIVVSYLLAVRGSDGVTALDRLQTEGPRSEESEERYDDDDGEGSKEPAAVTVKHRVEFFDDHFFTFLF